MPGMNYERLHLDLFSGLGGFALAARANGVRTIQFCECDPRCQAFLAKAWPGVPVWNDVRSLAYKPRLGCNVESSKGELRIEPSTCNPNAVGSVAESQRAKRGQETKGRNEHDRTDTGREETTGGLAQCFGDVWLLTAGVPCQPASRAGMQRGKEDDRWLWPEAIRVIAAVQPTWALLENPPGIGDVGLNGILSALEAQGYEVRVISIPACAVNAPHRRERYWIVCHKLADSDGDDDRGGRGSARETHGVQASDGAEQLRTWQSGRADGDAFPVGVGLADSNGPGSQGRDTEPGAHGLRAEYPQSEFGNAEAVPGIGRTRPIHQGQAKERRGGDPYTTGLWNSCVWLPCADGKVRRAPDDSISLVDGLHRSVLGALGNSIVWPVAAEIIKAMIKSENEDLHQM